MTILEGKKQLLDTLIEIYEEREAKTMSEMVLEKLTGLTRIQQLLDKGKVLDSVQVRQLGIWEKELLQHRPIQYILGESWFMGMPFFVQEGVLIPRPETAELVLWVLETMSGRSGNVLDIGTGSGCIAISIAKNNKTLNVSAIDKSVDALEIARKNNQLLDAAVAFQQMDVLSVTANDFPEKWDVIVSNPPYITENERKDMHQNVLDFEPEMALFVPNGEPLLFYRKIAEIATEMLKSGGYLFFEINENFGKETVSLLELLGFENVTLKKDLQGKDRMVKALWLVN